MLETHSTPLCKVARTIAESMVTNGAITAAVKILLPTGMFKRSKGSTIDCVIAKLKTQNPEFRSLILHPECFLATFILYLTYSVQ